jgi:hypothetical protein
VIGIITLRLFSIGANLHIGEICQNRGYGERNPPSSLSGKQNPRSGFGVTLAKLALYVRTEIKSIIREVSLSKKYPEKRSLSVVFKKLLG